jgi:hypothetical protein
MTPDTQTTTPKTNDRRWFRFRLRTLLVMVTLLSVPLGWVGWELDQRRREKAAIAWVEEMGGTVYLFSEAGSFDPRNWWKKTTDKWFGDRVHTVMLDSTQVSVLSLLTELKNLNELILINTQVTDLSPLTELNNLRSLRLIGTQLNDLSPLAELKNLERLALNSFPNNITRVCDPWQLADLKNLKSLELMNTQVIDISPLAELKNLEALKLLRTSVSDFSPLAESKNLKRLYLRSTQVIDEQVRELRLALPNCKIDHARLFIPPVLQNDHRNPQH